MKVWILAPGNFSEKNLKKSSLAETTEKFSDNFTDS